MDVSLEIAVGDKQKRWNWHIHLLLSRPLTTQEKEALKMAFPKDASKGVFKPVQEKKVQEGTLGKTASYVFKPNALFKSHYIARPTNRKPYRDCIKHHLKPAHENRLNRCFEESGFPDLIILIGLKRKRRKKDGPLLLMKSGRK